MQIKFFSSGVMSSWINLKRMLGWRQSWEEEAANELVLPCFPQQLSLQPWDQLTAQHEGTAMCDMALNHPRPRQQTRNAAEPTTQQKCMKWHEQENTISGSYHRKAFPAPRWMLTSHWATVTLFISTRMWLLQLIIKGRIFIIPSGWKVFLAPEGSSFTGYLGLLFSGVNWTTVHSHVLNMHFQSTQELHFMTFLKHILEGWCPRSWWNKYYLRHDLNLKDTSQRRK